MAKDDVCYLNQAPIEVLERTYFTAYNFSTEIGNYQSNPVMMKLKKNLT